MKSIAIRIYESLRGERKAPKLGLRLLQLFVTVAVLIYVYQRLTAEKDLFLSPSWTLSVQSGMLLLLGLAMMGLNLGLEAAKWFQMVRPVYPEVRFRTFFQAVFTGLATGIFTPNRVGEYAGRVMSLPPGGRVAAATYTLVDRVLQMIITLWMGLLGLVYMLATQTEMVESIYPFSPTSLLYVCGGLLLLCSLLLLAWFQPHFWVRKLQLVRSRHPFLQNVGKALSALSGETLRKVLGLGILRFAVFSSQYVLLLHAFGYEGELALILGMITLVFLLKSLVPSIALTELGVRESVALLVMETAGIGALTIVASTFVLFVINVIIPALIGLLFLYRIRV